MFFFFSHTQISRSSLRSGRAENQRVVEPRMKMERKELSLHFSFPRVTSRARARSLKTLMPTYMSVRYAG